MAAIFGQFPANFRFSGALILGPPYCGIGATIRIGREMLCLPYAGFLKYIHRNVLIWPHIWLKFQLNPKNEIFVVSKMVQC